MSDTTNQLALASAKALRNLPSSIWDQFLEAIAEHTRIQVQNCIQSPPDQLATAQGRAQDSTYILRIMTNCIQMADKIERNN